MPVIQVGAQQQSVSSGSQLWIPAAGIFGTAGLLRSDVPCDGPHDGQFMWDAAPITLGCARRSLFHFFLLQAFWRMRWDWARPS